MFFVIFEWVHVLSGVFLVLLSHRLHSFHSPFFVRQSPMYVALDSTALQGRCALVIVRVVFSADPERSMQTHTHTLSNTHGTSIQCEHARTFEKHADRL